jgi:hypothetical protein
MAKPESAPPESLLALLTPALRARYEAFAGMADGAGLAPAELLAFGRAVIDAAHGAAPWPTPANDAERAVNALAEKIPFAHHEITDAELAALRARLPDAQVVPLVMALCLHDAHRRLAIAWPGAPSGP